jgi:hypothetical protein
VNVVMKLSYLLTQPASASREELAPGVSWVVSMYFEFLDCKWISSYECYKCLFPSSDVRHSLYSFN